MAFASTSPRHVVAPRALAARAGAFASPLRVAATPISAVGRDFASEIVAEGERGRGRGGGRGGRGACHRSTPPNDPTVCPSRCSFSIPRVSLARARDAPSRPTSPDLSFPLEIVSLDRRRRAPRRSRSRARARARPAPPAVRRQAASRIDADVHGGQTLSRLHRKRNRARARRSGARYVQHRRGRHATGLARGRLGGRRAHQVPAPRRFRRDRHELRVGGHGESLRVARRRVDVPRPRGAGHTESFARRLVFVALAG